jgi:molybdopterin-guanine dinucleotide biosynthesis protein A
MRIVGAIVAGGHSGRMGREKAFVAVAGRTILARSIDRVAPQVSHLVINANGDAVRFARTGLAVIADLRPAIGTPLAGIHAGLMLARDEGFDAVLTVPSDCPFLPADLVARLAGAGRPAAIAGSGGQSHFLTGLWHAALLGELEAALDGGMVRVQDWARLVRAIVVEWPTTPFDPFFNVNTPEDLAEADRLAAQLPP